MTRPPGDDLAAKHDVLLAEETDGAERAVKVVVVNVRRDAVLHIIHIDDGCVWLFMLWQNAPSATICDSLMRRMIVDQVLCTNEPMRIMLQEV